MSRLRFHRVNSNRGLALSPDNWYSLRMNIEPVIRIGFGVLFIATLAGGYFLFKNFDRLLGPDTSVAGDNEGSRGLNKVQVIVIWLHLVAITGGFALLLH